MGFGGVGDSAGEAGGVAVCHAFGLKYKQRVASLLPMGVYTIPEISAAGETEESCKERKIDYCVGRARYENNARGHITGDTAGGWWRGFCGGWRGIDPGGGVGGSRTPRRVLRT